jgi:hypothetical protein
MDPCLLSEGLAVASRVSSFSPSGNKIVVHYST